MQAPWEAAIAAAVQQIDAQDKDVRVLDIGAGAGLHALVALRAGAKHVTAVERWLYLSLATKQSLVANGTPDDRAAVVYKRPTDLALLKDVAVCCNLLVCDILDDGLLTSGILPAMRHCIQNLMADDMILLPAAATVYCHAAEARTGAVCGFDMSAADRYRWHPAHTSGTTLAPGMYAPLSEPAEYLAGELPVAAGEVLPLRCSHNTVRLRFDLGTAEYTHLAKPDAAFPAVHFSMLADRRRNEAYEAAIARAVARKAAEDSAAHAVAANGFSERVSVVHCDVGLLQRGRLLGCNWLYLLDLAKRRVQQPSAAVMIPCLLGCNWLYLLDLAKRRVLQPGAAVVPAGATLFCVGIEALTGDVSGFDFSGLNTYRWETNARAVHLADMPHRVLTHPARVFNYSFEGAQKARSRENILRLEVIAEGRLNAIAFWFDLHLDAQALQYLDCGTLAAPGAKVMVLARREGGKVSDFLMRVKSRRFPSIEKDMKMVYHEMVVLERIHSQPQFCPGALLEALTSAPLRLH
ncbi:hypothetical protein WJX81_000365 [Elliptochloris bilobata]|uniref:Uncharacterized protein n=1 Tax=Elliptochloris bilobata TaxID=381761 RepID=A0AAW1RRW9_9CHLO